MIMMHPPRRPIFGAMAEARAYLSTTPNPLPASFLRGGTSKGIYLRRTDLPHDILQWPRIVLGIMGSPDPEYGRQLNGMGGRVSSLSKIVVVGPASGTQKEQGADVEYTFIQIGIRDDIVDFSGNCGNLTSMVGVFALDEGLCAPNPQMIDSRSDPPTATVRCFNTNTNKRIDTTFPVVTRHGHTTATLDLETASIAGVPGKASQIISDYISPGGARTGKLLPSSSVDELSVPMPDGSAAVSISTSLVDASNPTVILESDSLRKALGDSTINYADPSVLGVLETIRRLGAERMGLDPNAQAQPKISVVSEPEPGDTDVDLVAHTLSMGVLHRAIPMTVGLCLGVAANVEKTLPWAVVRRAREKQGRNGGSLIRIRHPGGTVDVGASVDSEDEVKSAKVLRTGRRLMKGVVWW